METTNLQLKPIAVIETPFHEKFGIPRQSGISSSVIGKIVFFPEYRNPDALRGLEGFSHIWLIFDFTKAHRKKWSPTVRPPRLGGNTHIGVFASRSPFRPNPLGLSSVKIEKISYNDKQGTVIYVSGVDMLSGTLIYDIKPYIPYSDSHSEATAGYAVSYGDYSLDVVIPKQIEDEIEDKTELKAIRECLSADPRPSYHEDSRRIYTMSYSDSEISFKVDGNKLLVTKIEKRKI